MMGCTLVIAMAAIILADAVSAQPQRPSCGRFEFLEDTMVETRLFRKGTCVIHSIGVPCEEVLGADGFSQGFSVLETMHRCPGRGNLSLKRWERRSLLLAPDTVSAFIEYRTEL